MRHEPPSSTSRQKPQPQEAAPRKATNATEPPRVGGAVATGDPDRCAAKDHRAEHLNLLLGQTRTVCHGARSATIGVGNQKRYESLIAGFVLRR
jgi:hypothetical protein